MSVNVSHIPPLRKAAASNRNFIITALTGIYMTLLACFVPDGTITGMFGIWGISLIGVAVDGYLLLRFWGAYN